MHMSDWQLWLVLHWWLLLIAAAVGLVVSIAIVVFLARRLGVKRARFVGGGILDDNEFQSINGCLGCQQAVDSVNKGASAARCFLCDSWFVRRIETGQ